MGMEYRICYVSVFYYFNIWNGFQLTGWRLVAGLKQTILTEKDFTENVIVEKGETETKWEKTIKPFPRSKSNK